MDSFKIYLPSNASKHLYPNNRPSDYRTWLNHAIYVDGEWEVGVESIFYSSNFDKEGEKAQIGFGVHNVTSKTNNSVYPYEMVTGNDMKGVGEVTPQSFETNPDKISSILDSINSVNDLILNPRKKKQFGGVFDFYLKDKNVVYTSYDNGFTLKITSNLASALGFGSRTTFSGSIIVKATTDKPKNITLSKEDYKVRFLNTKVLHKKNRIIIKAENEVFDGNEQLFSYMWLNSVEKEYNIRVEFQSTETLGHRLVIHNDDNNLILSFSKDFSNTFGHESIIIGKTTQEPNASYNLHIETGLFASQVWYVDVFSHQYEFMREASYKQLSLELFPWRYRNHKKLFAYINKSVLVYLKKILKDDYDASNHSFTLHLHNDDHCKVTLGKWLTVSFSKNLSNLLGFPEKYFMENELTSSREVISLTDRKQQLFLLSDVIKPTAIGNHQLQTLQHFLHNPVGEEIIEKQFDPIHYLPIMTNYMDTINIQLTDESYKPIAIKDSKTIVTLYFQKIKAK